MGEKKRPKTNKGIDLHNVYQSNSRCNAWKDACIEKDGGCNDETRARRVIHMENFNNSTSETH